MLRARGRVSSETPDALWHDPWGVSKIFVGEFAVCFYVFYVAIKSAALRRI